MTAGGAARVDEVADNYKPFFEDVDPNATMYEPDLTRQAVDDQDAHDVAVRLTWQANQQNKIQFYFNDSSVCHCHQKLGTLATLNVMPSAAPVTTSDNQVYQATWTSTVTNRLLLEAGFSAFPGAQRFRDQPEINLPALPGILEVGGDRISSREMSAWLIPGRSIWDLEDTNTTGRASLSYVTGSHALKVGTTIQFGNSPRDQTGPVGNYIQLTTFGSPFAAWYNTYPRSDTNYMRSIGLYGQDQWTLDRLTVNAGVRFDYFRTGYPDHDLQETLYGPAAFHEGQDVATWKDLSPRLGVVYDLFGNGRTAVKVIASRYVDGIGTTLSSQVNPALQNSGSLRPWLDGDRPVPIPGFEQFSRVCYSPDGVSDLGYLLGGPTQFGCIAEDGIP